jgi:hypothetical protein
MVPVGYMAKRRLQKKPDWVKDSTVNEIYSVCDCVSKNFADYVKFWKHNGYWLFDSPEIIKHVAAQNGIDLRDTSLFFYEAHEMEFDGEHWRLWACDPSFKTAVSLPSTKQLEGFDVVNFTARTGPECSTLACTRLAEELGTNSHCLFDSFEQAWKSVDDGSFNDCEPGPYRIFAVYSVEWDG